eukprot:scaffold160387_cov15-Tisochrysis_lutea.AAC.1
MKKGVEGHGSSGEYNLGVQHPNSAQPPPVSYLGTCASVRHPKNLTIKTPLSTSLKHMLSCHQRCFQLILSCLPLPSCQVLDPVLVVL